MTDAVGSWVKPLAGIIGLHTLPLVSVGKTWVLFSSDIDGSQVPSEINTVQSQVQSSKVPFQGQLLARPWLEITPDLGPWTHSVPVTTGTVVQIQSCEESVRTQIHHIVDRVNTVAKPVTYNLHPWVPLVVNKIEFWTHSTLNAVGSQYPTATQTLEPWLQPLFNIVGSQEPVEKKDGYWVFAESKSTQFWTSSALNMPFASVGNSHGPWAEYKADMIRPSRQMDRIHPLSKHGAIIVKPQMQTIDTTWPLAHTIANEIEPFSHSEVDTIRPWTRPEASVVQTWTQSETQARRPLTQPKTDRIRPWLQTKTERIRRWIQPKFQTVRSRTQTEEGKYKHWTQPKADTVRSWIHPEVETVSSWEQPEAVTARHWFWTKSDQMIPRTHPVFKALHPWPQPGVDMVRPWTQSEAESIPPWTRPEASTFRPCTQSKVNTVTPWTKPEAEGVRLRLQTHTDTIRTWSQPESRTVIS